MGALCLGVCGGFSTIQGGQPGESHGEALYLCLLLQKMAALLAGKRLDISNGFVMAIVLPFGHEVTEEIPSMYLSSVPGMRALEKHTEP